MLLVGSYGPSLLNFRGALITALVARNHEVHVAAPNLSDGLVRSLQGLGAKVHEIPLDRQGSSVIADLSYVRRLRVLFLSISPGLVITYTIKPNIWGALAGATTGTRTAALVTGLGIVFTDIGRNSLKTRILNTLVRIIYRIATHLNWRVFFQNPDDLADFKAAGCLTDLSKVRMMNGSGVDLARYAPAPLPDAPNFLMISRILGAKGVREYANAAVGVKKIHPEASFRLVGFYDLGPDSISEDEVEEWIAGGLEYLGPIEDVRSQLADCRVYVLPSYREGTPRSVLEAMATGRAILTSDAPGCRETVTNEVNGFLVPVRDVASLADRMRQMIEEPDLAEIMGQASLEIVREKYDVRKVNELLLRDLNLV